MNWLLPIALGVLVGILNVWQNSPRQIAKRPTAEEFNRRLWTPEDQW